jgi:prophage regulatory protein
MDANDSNKLPQSGLVRIWQIIGSKKRGLPPILPVSKSTLWNWIKQGKWPPPIKLSARVSCWDVETVREALAALQNSKKEA